MIAIAIKNTSTCWEKREDLDMEQKERTAGEIVICWVGCSSESNCTKGDGTRTVENELMMAGGNT